MINTDSLNNLYSGSQSTLEPVKLILNQTSLHTYETNIIQEPNLVKSYLKDTSKPFTVRN